MTILDPADDVPDDVSVGHHGPGDDVWGSAYARPVSLVVITMPGGEPGQLGRLGVTLVVVEDPHVVVRHHSQHDGDRHEPPSRRT
jgi:hypothetical protein